MRCDYNYKRECIKTRCEYWNELIRKCCVMTVVGEFHARNTLSRKTTKKSKRKPKRIEIKNIARD